MSRKSFLLAVCIALVLVGGTSAGLFLLVRHEPDSYREGAIPPGPERVRESEAFKSEFFLMYNAARPGGEREWDIRLTDKQINSYFAEDFRNSKLDERVLPEDISDPRVTFEQGEIRLSFRYGKGLWSTVISLDIRVWAPESEPNVLALQLTGLHAGSLPVSAQTLLDSLSRMLEDNGIQVSWYRHEGHPTALLRFQADQREPTIRLGGVHVTKGHITIRGKPVDDGPTRAAALPNPRGEDTVGN